MKTFSPNIREKKKETNEILQLELYIYYTYIISILERKK